jgi:hypothetical protein
MKLREGGDPPDPREQFDRYLAQATEGQYPAMCGGLDADVLYALSKVAEDPSADNVIEAKKQFRDQMDGTHSRQEEEALNQIIRKAVRDNTP